MIFENEKNVDFYLYFLGRRWRIGPTLGSFDCWIFSSIQNRGERREITEKVDWFSHDEKRNPVLAPVRIIDVKQMKSKKKVLQFYEIRK